MSTRPFNTALLVAGPLLAAGLDWPLWGAAAWLVVLLVWRWGTVVASLGPAARGPELELESISASHFVEKVRWSLDWLDVPYTETAMGGTLGAFFLGRTVPRLKFRTGIVVSQIGNSAEILRYLWGRYCADKGPAAKFLEPTEQALALETTLDRYGADLQVWVYSHLLPHRDLTLQAWGANDPALPVWQRWFLRLFYPLDRLLMTRAFRLTTNNFERSVLRIEALLADMEKRLETRRYLLTDDAPGFVDITFASLSALWHQPPAFANGRARAVQPPTERLPAEMTNQVARWKVRYPRSSGLIERMYEQRLQPAGVPQAG